MGLFICEFEFNQPDPKSPDYSMCEVDYYAHIPFPKQSEIPNHRLSLRKNLKTGKFELYRHFVGTLVRPFAGGTMIQDVELKQEEVAFAGSFEDALRFGNREVVRLWSDEDREPDEPCQHSYPNKVSFCHVYEKEAREELRQAIEKRERQNQRNPKLPKAGGS